jgi:hypothetical protein
MSEATRGLALTAGLFSPLAITSALAEPELTALGFLLQLGLGRITVNKLSKGAMGVAKIEETALAKLVTTSTTNRLVRVVLGSVHVLAAISLAERRVKAWQQQASDEQDKKQGVAGILRSAANIGGTFLLCFMAGIWISSGFYGQ